jgi:hypothetical protein
VNNVSGVVPKKAWIEPAWTTLPGLMENAVYFWVWARVARVIQGATR